MGWEWLNTALDYGGRALDAIDTVGNAYGRFAGNPLVNAGAGYLAADRASDRNEAATNAAIQELRTGMNNANRTVRNFRGNTLRTAGQTYNTARRATAPYRQAGTRALDSYMDILEDPAGLYDDPAYQWALDQGLEGISRRAAATGFRGSGNEMIDFIKFGQGNAMQYRDDILGDYAPIISAGQTATGQFMDAGRHRDNVVAATNYGASREISENERSMGEYGAGLRLNRARNDTEFDAEFLRLLGIGGDPRNPNQAPASGAGGALDAANNVRTGAGVVREIGNLANAGGGNPLAAIRDSLPGSGNDWATASGPRTSPRMPTGNPLSSAGSGMAAGWGAETALGTEIGNGLYMGADGLITDLSTKAAANAAGGSTAATAGSLLTGVGLAASMWAGLEFLQGMKNFKGGAAESAKTGKLVSQLQRDLQADPSGRTARQTVGRLVNGQLWPGEANGWVIGDLMKQGIIKFNDPLLYSAKSKVDIFGTVPVISAESMANKTASAMHPGRVTQYMSYGIPAAQATRYADLQKKLDSATKQWKSERDSGDDVNWAGLEQALEQAAASVYTPQERQFMQSIERQMTPQRHLQTAIQTRQQILEQNPRADVSKLNTFIRQNSRGRN